MVRHENNTAEDYCRVCKCCFKTYVGNFKKVVHSSSQNIFKPSQRKDILGVVLSDLCLKIGIPLEQGNQHSTKVCRSCSTKIQKVHELFKFLKSSINVPHKNFVTSPPSTPSSNTTTKRRLLTPDRGVSPGNRKSARNDSPAKRNPGATSKKCLFESKVTMTQDCEDNFLSCLNIDDLKSCEGRSGLRMKVVMVHPNGTVVVRNPRNEQTVQIIRNITEGGWAAVANAIFSHKEVDFQQELRLALQRKINKEFMSYSKMDSILTATGADDIAAYSNKLLNAEARLHCPFWTASLIGAAGCAKELKKSVNERALTTAVIARARNPKMSVVAYRISNILIHSGSTFQDITRLSKLGVCMSPKSTVRLQEKMGEWSSAKVLKWKSTIESNKNRLQLLKEIVDTQTPSLAEDSMEVEFDFDLREEALKDYKSYVPSVYKDVVNFLSEKRGELTLPIQSCSEDVLLWKIQELEGEQLPFYK